MNVRRQAVGETPHRQLNTGVMGSLLPFAGSRAECHLQVLQSIMPVLESQCSPQMRGQSRDMLHPSCFGLKVGPLQSSTEKQKSSTWPGKQGKVITTKSSWLDWRQYVVPKAVYTTRPLRKKVWSKTNTRLHQNNEWYKFSAVCRQKTALSVSCISFSVLPTNGQLNLLEVKLLSQFEKGWEIPDTVRILSEIVLRRDLVIATELQWHCWLGQIL